MESNQLNAQQFLRRDLDQGHWRHFVYVDHPQFLPFILPIQNVVFSTKFLPMTRPPPQSPQSLSLMCTSLCLRGQVFVGGRWRQLAADCAAAFPFPATTFSLKKCPATPLSLPSLKANKNMMLSSLISFPPQVDRIDAFHCDVQQIDVDCTFAFLLFKMHVIHSQREFWHQQNQKANGIEGETKMAIIPSFHPSIWPFPLLPLLLALLHYCRPMLLHIQNASIPNVPGLEPMSSLKSAPIFTIVERVSRTKQQSQQQAEKQRKRRQVIAGQIYEWHSNLVPFQIWGGDANFQNLIRRGIRMWEESTCLRFRENMQAQDAIRYVLERGDSCFTEYIGRNGGFQDIIIGSECAEEYVVAHETGHALGFWHTHQRPDRERYISINWRNVLEEATASFMPFRSMLQAFGIKQVSARRAPYDYGSLMHYHAVAHARQVTDFTIVPKELKYVTTMGTERMAFLDAKMINDIYCPNACSGFGTNGRPLHCQAGGYPDPNNCQACRCPEGLGGVECERLQPSSCGGELVANDQWQTLRSPHGKDVQCFWRISTPEGSRVRFRLSDGEFPCSYGCQSYVEIKHKLDVRLTGFRSCCYRPKEDTISDGNQIFVIFRPNGRTARFSLRYIRQP